MISIRWRYRWTDLFARGLRGLVAILVLPAAAAYLALLGIAGVIRQDTQLLAWLIVGILALWVLLLAAMWVRNRGYWGREMVATADASGLHLATGSYQVTIRWEGLASAQLRRRTVELRWTDPSETLWIPVRAFASRAEVNGFVDFARSQAEGRAT